MEIKNVIGDNSPEVFEKLQGGTLINVPPCNFSNISGELSPITFFISIPNSFVVFTILI